MNSKNVMQMTVEIVAAYLGNNAVSYERLPQLIETVHKALASLETSKEAVTEAAKPAVPVSRSVVRGYVACLEDGKRFKFLKRHLRAAHGLSPEDYRAKWGLPKGHPLVAPAYSAKRSKIAKKLGLGRKPKADEARSRTATRRSAPLKTAA